MFVFTVTRRLPTQAEQQAQLSLTMWVSGQAAVGSHSPHSTHQLVFPQLLHARSLTRLLLLHAASHSGLTSWSQAKEPCISNPVAISATSSDKPDLTLLSFVWQLFCDRDSLLWALLTSENLGPQQVRDSWAHHGVQWGGAGAAGEEGTSWPALASVGPEVQRLGRPTPRATDSCGAFSCWSHLGLAWEDCWNN